MDYYAKGRLDYLQNIPIKRTVDGTYKTKDLLKEYVEIHLKSKHERFIDGANRILLVLGTCSLFAADVSYHKSCCKSSRFPDGKEK